MTNKKVQLENKITDILICLKIKPNMLGFDYLRKSIELCIDDGELLNNVTKDLYPLVAKEYNVSPAIVERCIRNSITNAYKTKGLLGVNDLFDAVVYSNDFKLSNSELIAIVVEKIRIDKLKEDLKTLKSIEKA